MASTASSFTPSSSTTTLDARPQAGPLPKKRGEIGFQEEVHGQDHSDSPEMAAFPERHPADREAPVTTRREGGSDDLLLPSPPPSAHTRPPTVVISPPAPTITDSSSTRSTSKSRLIAFLKPKKLPSYAGFRLTTILFFIAQLILFGGTIAGWALATIRINRTAGANNSDASQFTGATSGVFVHVIFGLISLSQLIFLERRVFRLRAERYTYVHPGEMLPTSRHRFNTANSNIGLAPWLRPPLPTYAAALAQSGHGTGDVEDRVIAVPPPPAYGNTRGSTLVLAGFLRESLRAQRPQSEQSRMSHRSDRPVSYMSHDEGWETVRDAERARQLEETLSTLERPPTAASVRR